MNIWKIFISDAALWSYTMVFYALVAGESIGLFSQHLRPGLISKCLIILGLVVAFLYATFSAARSVAIL